MSQEADLVHEVWQLRALLTMAREMMQIDDRSMALALAGRSVIELSQAGSALLLVRGPATQAIGFDRNGTSCEVDKQHEGYQMALDWLASGANGVSRPTARTMVLGVPAQQAMAVLVAGWDDDAGPDTWASRQRVLEAILELSIATLARISTRSSLEHLVSIQYDHMADTAQAHADELARRDKLETEARVLALTDVLTGLNNRRGFFVQAEQLFKLAQRRRAASAVIYADIDDLKLVNDRLGHDAGDRLIQDAAVVFQESFRSSDVVARLGGDEFVAFALDDAQPSAILDRLKGRLKTFNKMRGRPYQLSVSVGIVQCDPDNGTSLLDYLQLADKEMYRHKRRRLQRQPAPTPAPHRH